MDAIAYIDGFNLYYGSLKGTPNKWLDLQAFVQRIAPKDLEIKKIRYFTAKVKPSQRSPSAHTDQQAYLDAIGAHCPLVEVHYGDFLRHKVRMENALPPPATLEVYKSEEKGSDVNLAVHLLNDAWAGSCATAILISNDSDLAEAVRLTTTRRVRVLWFPPVANPDRYPSVELRRSGVTPRSIYDSAPAKCQLPSDVIAVDRKISKPVGW